MVRKIALTIVVLGVAAFSPAPMNKAKGPRTFQPEMSQADVAKQQIFNGVSPVVGQVPRVTNEVGQTRNPNQTQPVDHSGEGSILAGSAKADKVGGSIAQASARIESEEHPAKYAWIFGLLIAALGFVGWKLFQYKIEKSTPVPEFSKRFLKEFAKK